MKHEEIENVNDEMLDMLIAEHKYVSALFYDDLDRMSARILTELENIDDDAETKDIYMVRLDIDQENKDILAKFGIPDKLPQLGTVSISNNISVITIFSHKLMEMKISNFKIS